MHRRPRLEIGQPLRAPEPIRQGVREHFGGFDRGIAANLAIRHYHGSGSMSDDFRRELALLGLGSSPSFVRDPKGSGCAGPFIRTLEEDLLWVRYFATVAELSEAPARVRPALQPGVADRASRFRDAEPGAERFLRPIEGFGIRPAVP